MTTDVQQIEHPELEAALGRLKASGDNTVLNSYLAALVAAGWTKVVLGEILSVSHQAVSQRVRSARNSIVDVSNLPVPTPPPARRYALATRTKSGLPVPDTAQITATAQENTRASIAAIQGTPMERLAALGDFVDGSAAHLRTLEAEREELTWSLTCYDRQKDLARAGGWDRRVFHKRRLQVLGISSEQLKSMTAAELETLATSLGIRRHPGALQKYAVIARQIIEAETTLRVAQKCRDGLVAEVVTQDENGRNRHVVAAAAAINRSPTTIWQILQRLQDAGYEPTA